MLDLVLQSCNQVESQHLTGRRGRYRGAILHVFQADDPPTGGDEVPTAKRIGILLIVKVLKDEPA
jgi:hypothetical protein